MIIPGIVSATFKKESPEFVLEAAKAAGLKAVEWSENWHVAPGDTEAAAELYRKTQDAGLAVAAYGSYYKLGVEEDPVSRFDQSLRTAYALRAPLIRIWGGIKASRDITGPEWDDMVNEARQAAEAADAMNIKVALEWHRNTLTDTNESAERFLSDVNHRNLYCLWQPTPDLSMEQRREGLDMLERRGKLLNLHVYYWEDDGRHPFAEGVDAWRTYLAHVNRDEDRYALMEFVKGDSREQLIADAKCFEELLEEKEN